MRKELTVLACKKDHFGHKFNSKHKNRKLHSLVYNLSTSTVCNFGYEGRI